MDATALIRSLMEGAPGAHVEEAPSVDGQPTVFVEPADLLAVLKIVRDAPALRFSCLADLTAADFWPREPRFEVVYHFLSIELGQRLRVKVRLAGADAHVASAASIWPAAQWLEREVWDLFGVAFDDHPDPRRLLMPEDWEGHPLRKDYPVQIRMTPRTSEPMQVTEAEFRANLQRDRLSRR